MTDTELVAVLSEIADLEKRLVELRLKRDALQGNKVEKVKYKARTWQCCNKNALCVAFDPRGNFVATGGQDLKVQVWKPNGTEECQLDAGYGTVNSVKFSPTEDLVLSGESYGHVRLWDISSQKEIATFKSESAIRGVCFAPNGKHALAVTTGQRVMLIDIDQKELLKEFHGHVHAISGVSACKTRAATCDEGGYIKFWDMETLKQLGSIHDKDISWQSVALSEAEELVVCGDRSGLVKFFDYEGEELGCVKVGDTVNGVAFSPDGQSVVVATQGSEVLIIDVHQYKVVKKLSGHEHQVTGVSFAPDGGAFVTVSYDKTARLWPVDA